MLLVFLFTDGAVMRSEKLMLMPTSCQRRQGAASNGHPSERNPVKEDGAAQPANVADLRGRGVFTSKPTIDFFILIQGREVLTKECLPLLFTVQKRAPHKQGNHYMLFIVSLFFICPS